MNTSPTISVCLATYNGEKYIEEQLNSILSQLPENAEIVISDDVSTDNTVTRINSINDRRISLIQNKTRQGVVANFEKAITRARGQYIYLSDQDDIWHPDKIIKTLPHLSIHSLLCHDCTLVNEKNEVICESLFSINKGGKGIVKNIVKNSYTGCCMAFRRDLLTIALPFPHGIYMHDVWLGLIAEIHGTVWFENNPLITYRRHTDALTNTGFTSPNSFLKKLRMRTHLILNIVLRVVKTATKNTSYEN